MPGAMAPTENRQHLKPFCRCPTRGPEGSPDFPPGLHSRRLVFDGVPDPGAPACSVLCRHHGLSYRTMWLCPHLGGGQSCLSLRTGPWQRGVEEPRTPGVPSTLPGGGSASCMPGSGWWRWRHLSWSLTTGLPPAFGVFHPEDISKEKIALYLNSLQEAEWRWLGPSREQSVG